jgi:hypothetical protein
MINAYLRTTVNLRVPIKDSYGNITGYTNNLIKARWTRKDRLVSIEGGEEVISSAQIIIKNQTINNTYKVEYDSVKYAIIDVQEWKDFSVRGLEVFLR